MEFKIIYTLFSAIDKQTRKHTKQQMTRREWMSYISESKGRIPTYLLVAASDNTIDFMVPENRDKVVAKEPLNGYKCRT